MQPEKMPLKAGNLGKKRKSSHFSEVLQGLGEPEK